MIPVSFALWGWLPVCVLLFAVLPPRKALFVGVIGGWLFLPVAGFAYHGLPEYHKGTAISCGVLLGALIFDTSRLARGIRLRWFDIPVLLMLLTPFVSAVANGIGGSLLNSLYGGMSLAIEAAVNWGIPYLLGRMYFTRLEHLRELAVALVIAGLIYMPLCLLESRLSPQLHRWVYGFHVRHAFQQTKRLGGFRPTVFLGHGLAVSMFMTVVSVVALWLWLSQAVRRIWVVPMSIISLALVATTILCRSSGAIVLLFMGICVLVALKCVPIRLILVLLICIPLTYMAVRTAGVWSGEGALEVLASVFGEQRAESLAGRMGNEDLFTDKAMQRPVFGWSGWNRFQVRSDSGSILTTPDGLWVIVFGQSGLVGLAGLVGFLLMPAVLVVKRVPVHRWATPQYGAALALAIVLVLFMIDCLLNAFLNPVYPMTVGGLLHVLADVRIAHRERRSAVAPTSQVPESVRLANGRNDEDTELCHG